MHKTVVINEEVEEEYPVVLQSKEYKDKFADTEPKGKPAIT